MAFRNWLNKVVGLGSGWDNSSALSRGEPLYRQLGERGYMVGRSKHQQRLRDWQDAIDAAESKLNPNRWYLYQQYKQALRLPIVEAVTSTMIQQVAAQRVYWLNPDGSVNESATVLTQKPWFGRLVRAVLETELWGHTLVEIVLRPGQDYDVAVLPRELVRPEQGLLVQRPLDTVGVAFRDADVAEQFNLVELWSDNPLGKLSSITYSAIIVKVATQYWLDLQTRFGSPPVVGKTAAAKQEAEARFHQVLQDIRSNSNVLIGLQDELSLLETQQTDIFKVFHEMIKWAEANIAQVVLGGSLLHGATASYAQAEQQERQAKSSRYQFWKGLVLSMLRNQLADRIPEFRGLEPVYMKSDERSFQEQLSMIKALHEVGYEVEASQLEAMLGAKIVRREQA